MKLFLTSNTITSELVKPFEDLIGKSIRGLKVVFIPDAAYGVPNKDFDSWVGPERQFLVDTYDWNVTDVVLKDLDKIDPNSLFQYDVVFVNGGLSGYLAKEMRRTGFDKILPVLFNEGLIYVGSSAGSMVMSDIQDASSWYIGEPEPEAINISGLGYINFQIYPHFKPELIKKIRKKRDPKLSYYLLKNGQAISVEGETMKLHGDIVHLPAEA